MTEASAIVCRVCGGPFVLPAGELLCPCPACGTPHPRPRVTGDGLAVLRHAHQQRAACDFTNAAENYQRALNVCPDEAEALWGLALCKYGVEYVRDERTGEHLPVIHFLNRRPFTEDPDCRLAIARADAALRPRYLRDAEYIARIQQEVLATESRGESCDVFLCYKASVPGSADPSARTREFEYARELYAALRDAGYKVFFAHTTLRHAAGANYEAQIFRALHSARVMLVITAMPEYLTTPWVHSEWSRYLERVDNHENCLLIPLLYDDCDPYALPDAFIRRSLQGLPMGELTSLDDLRRILDTRLGRTTASSAAPAMDADTSRALLRISMALEDGDWQKAATLAAALIDSAPDCAEAHLTLLLARLKLPNAAALATCLTVFDADVNWKRACQFADPALLALLQEYLALASAARQTARATEERARRQQEEADKQYQHDELILTAKSKLAKQQWPDASHCIDLALSYRESSEAHLLRLLCDLRLAQPEQLSASDAEFEKTDHWQNAFRLASPELRATLMDIVARHATHLQAKQARRQHQEAERARLANAKGSVTFARTKGVFRNSKSLIIHAPGSKPRLLLANDSISFKVVNDCEFRIFTPDGKLCYSYNAKANYRVMIAVRWPLLGKPTFTVVSTSPA